MIKTGVYLYIVMGLLTLYMWPSSKYEWIDQLSPSPLPHSLIDSSQNRTVFISILFFSMVASLWLIFNKIQSFIEKCLSLFLIFVAGYFWYLKW